MDLLAKVLSNDWFGRTMFIAAILTAFHIISGGTSVVYVIMLGVCAFVAGVSMVFSIDAETRE